MKATNSDFSLAQLDRTIEMAWEERTAFDAIQFQFNLSESAVRELMKKELNLRSYKLWPRRVKRCKTKHKANESWELSALNLAGNDASQAT